MTKIILPPRMSPVGYHIDEAYMVPDPEGECYDREELLAILKDAGVEVEETPMITAGSRVTRNGIATPLWRECCEAAGVDVYGVFVVSRVDYDCDDAKLWLSGVVINIAFKLDQGFHIRNFRLVE